MHISQWIATLLVGLNLYGTFASWAVAQDKEGDVARDSSSSIRADPVPRPTLFRTESLDEPTRKLSNDLLLKALDSEAFYTLTGQLKPASEGFWGGYFSVAPPELSELEQVRSAVRAWNVPNLYHADVLVYETVQDGLRYASAYVVHLPSLKRLILSKRDFFGRWGIDIDTPPSEVLMAIERSRQPEDRWRGFGLIFGYPEYAIDFFVAAGLHQRTTGEFVERDFRQIATFAGRSGQFVYAVPKLSRSGPEDVALQRRAAALLMEYKRLRPQYMTPTKNPVELLRDWMDDGSGNCHPDHLIAKLPSKTEAQLDAEIATWSDPEIRPPELRFNHLKVVLSQEAFEAIRASDFFQKEFATSDQGLPGFLPVDDQAKSICLRGQDTSMELFSPEYPFQEPMGQVAVGWSVKKEGDLDAVEKRLRENTTSEWTRTQNPPDLHREPAMESYSKLVRQSPSPNDATWWFYERHTNTPESRFDKSRLFKNVTHLTLELPRDTAKGLRSDLEKLGYRTDEFDSRTWILKGLDFRLMLVIQPNGAKSKLKSIGFTTNPGTSPSSPVHLGEAIEITFDENHTGWIEFQDSSP